MLLSSEVRVGWDKKTGHSRKALAPSLLGFLGKVKVDGFIKNPLGRHPAKAGEGAGENYQPLVAQHRR
jgi:hypothetical protein